MRRFTRKWLEYKIVQVCERFPNTVGLPGQYNNGTRQCLTGFIGVDSGEAGHKNRGVSDRYFKFITKPGIAELTSHAQTLNDKGTRWGRIPKLLGLVPGEMKVPKTTKKTATKAKAKEGVFQK